jgi:hypothetical protein
MDVCFCWKEQLRTNCNKETAYKYRITGSGLWDVRPYNLVDNYNCSKEPVAPIFRVNAIHVEVSSGNLVTSYQTTRRHTPKHNIFFLKVVSVKTEKNIVKIILKLILRIVGCEHG